MKIMKIIRSGQIDSRLMRSIRNELNDLTRVVPAATEPVAVQKDVILMKIMIIIKSGQIESRLMRSMRNDLTRLVPATAGPVTVHKEVF